MGLDIIAKVSEKEYHFSYSGIHQIRWLALLSVGYPEEINGKLSLGSVTFPYFEDKIEKEVLSSILWGSKLAGYYYPNLLFHSDCEGTYTKRGKVLNHDNLMSGNSTKLLKELELLKDDLDEKLKTKYERAWGIFNMFYDLVKDEVENGKGHLQFC